MTGGRPLRFLALVGVSWATLRIAFLWQETGSLPEAIRRVAPISRAVAAVDRLRRPPAAPIAAPVSRRPALASTTAVGAAGRARTAAIVRKSDPWRVQMALLAMTRLGPPRYPDEASTTAGHSQRVEAAGTAIATAAASRLSFSSWAIARGGVGLGASPSAPQLGGAQGGIRADYALGGGVALTGRVAAPAAGAGREASLGIAWRPGGGPLRFVAEQRVALDGGRGGPALGVSGGVGDVPLPAGIRLDAYGQAGAILRDGIEHYVDGSARITRPLVELGGVSLDVGAGAWGGAQRGVLRVDIGPSIGVRAPVAGRTLRLSLDWRQRIAGSARPGSGPALSIGSDF